MKTLLKAVRDVLTSDATLVNLVGSADDIRSTYAATSADYPVVALSVGSGGSDRDASGITSATLLISVRSAASKGDPHDIYARIKTLLHNQERSVTNATCLVHLILETEVSDSDYDRPGDVWLIRAEYQVIFSEAGIVVTTSSDGAIYADLTDVSVDAAKLIATFRGSIALSVEFMDKERNSGERFPNSIYHDSGAAKILIEEVTFKPATFATLWNITANESDTLADDATAATTYTVVQTTAPVYLQFLFHCTQTHDGKALEIQADRAICPQLRIPFSKRDLTIHECEFICLGDANSNVVKVSTQN